MATIKDGEYYIVPAANTALALDVQGSDSQEWSDRNGTNLWVYTRGGSDGQFVHVRNVGGALELYIALTFKAVDYVADGGNVSQWDWHGGTNQQWTPTKVGTVTVDGTSYTTYSLANVADSTKYLTAAGSTSGSNLSGAAYTGAGTQMWAFVPVASGVPDGWYSILTGMDESLALDVAGRNTANGTNVQIWSYSGENNQIWRSVSNGDGTVGIRNCMSGKYLDIPGTGTVADGANVQQWAADGVSDQRWLIYADGTLSRNGCKVPAFAIANQAGAAYRLDVAGGSTRLCTNVQLWSKNGSLAQRFELMATEPYDGGLPVPSGLAAAGEQPGHQLWGTGTITVSPSWMCSGSGYQLRYRTRERAYDSATAGAWGAWTSPTGANSNAGWGVPGSANVAPTLDDGRWTASSVASVTLAADGIDRADIEVQVRRVDTSNAAYGSAHGALASATISALYRPTCTISGLTLSPEGLHLTYSADQRRGNNALTVYSVTGTAGGVFSDDNGLRFIGRPCSGTVVVPFDRLERIPDDGEILTVTLRYANVDGAESTASAAVTLAYKSGSGMSLSPSVTVGEDLMAYIDVTGITAPRVWWQDSDGMHEVVGSAVGYAAPAPLNEAWRVWVVSETSTAWGVWSEAQAAIATPYYVWSWVDGGKARSFRAAVGVGSAPGYSVKDEPDYNSQTTNGDAYEVVTFGGARKQSVSFEGAVTEGLPSLDAEADALAMDGQFAWFRTPGGDVMRVAVVGVSIDRQSRDYRAVSVDMKRVDY